MPSQQLMIVVGVPAEHLDPLLEAMAAAGAGVIGNYTHCAFTSDGMGRFKPSGEANPAYGQREQINTVPEVRIETFCERSRAQPVVEAIRQTHPYEEPVIYLIPLLGEDEL